MGTLNKKQVAHDSRRGPVPRQAQKQRPHRASGVVHCSNPHGPGEHTRWVLSLHSAGAGENFSPSQELSSPTAESAEQSMRRQALSSRATQLPQRHRSRIWEGPTPHRAHLLLHGMMQPCPADSQRSLFLRKMSKS